MKIALKTIKVLCSKEGTEKVYIVIHCEGFGNKSSNPSLFSFIQKDLYSGGTPCDFNSKSPCFQSLLLETVYDISDVDLVECLNMTCFFKYFWDRVPEDDVIDSSSLTKFCRLRFQDID